MGEVEFEEITLFYSVYNGYRSEKKLKKSEAFGLENFLKKETKRKIYQEIKLRKLK